MLAILSTLAQVTSDFNSDYSYPTTMETTNSTAAAGLAIGLVLFILVFVLAAYIFFAICLMKIFKKAGRKDAWAAWIPVYNMWVYFEIAGRPGWWGLLSLISPLNLILGIIGSIDLAKKFGKDAGYGILLAILPIIGYPMLAFGDATYNGTVPANNFGTPPEPSPTSPSTDSFTQSSEEEPQALGTTEDQDQTVDASEQSNDDTPSAPGV